MDKVSCRQVIETGFELQRELFSYLKWEGDAIRANGQFIIIVEDESGLNALRANYLHIQSGSFNNLYE